MKSNIMVMVLLIGSLLWSSCKKIEDLQEDPAAVYHPAPKLIFTGLLMRIYDAPWSQDQRYNQYMTQNEAYYAGQPYDWKTGSFDEPYGALRDINRMEMEAKNAGELGAGYLSIAKFLKAYFYARATEMFGDIPMAEAIQGESENNFQPNYDVQQQIYEQVLSWLEEANTELAAMEESGIALEGDFFYDGNLDKWRKLVNSFKLRVLISLSKRADDTPSLRVKERFAEILANPAVFPLILTNADNFQLLYNTINIYPLWPADGIVIKRDTRNTLAATYMDIMRENQDPRILIQALPAESVKPDLENIYHAYRGGSTGDLQSTLLGQANNGLLSMINFDYWVTGPSGIPAIQLGASEVNFCLAEGINRKWASGDAAEYYEKGIMESMTFYGVHQVDSRNFLDHHPYTGNTAKGLEQILIQKYVAFFENSGKQAFLEQRRTGVPNFDVGPANANNNQIPVRWAYPTTEYSTNEAHLKGALQRQFNGSDTQNDIMWLIK